MLNYTSDTVQSTIRQIDELVEQIEAMSAPERQDLQTTLHYLNRLNSYNPNARVLVRAVTKVLNGLASEEPADEFPNQ